MNYIIDMQKLGEGFNEGEMQLYAAGRYADIKKEMIKWK